MEIDRWPLVLAMSERKRDVVKLKKSLRRTRGVHKKNLRLLIIDLFSKNLREIWDLLLIFK